MNSISEAFVPHTGNMCLLGELKDFSDDSLTALCQIEQGNIFLSDLGLHNTILIEYMAQTIAAHAKMCGQPDSTSDEANIGFLLGVKHFSCSIPWLKVRECFSVTVNLDIKMATGLAVFDGRAKGDSFVATARLSVFQPPDIEQFLQETRTV